MKNRMKPIVLPILAATAFVMAGCASYTIQPIASDDLDKWAGGKLDQGYVFYQPELYFLVTATSPKAAEAATVTNATPTDETEKASTNALAAEETSKAPTASASDGQSLTFSVTPIYLPNPKKRYRVTTFNFLAKSDFTFNFKDGWQLTSIADKADNSTVTTALIGQMQSMLNAAVKASVAPPTQLPSTFLLHPKYNDDGVIKGFTPIYLPDFSANKPAHKSTHK
jgi:hypothetical protein